MIRTLDIHSERPTRRGWSWTVVVQRGGDEPPTEHVVTLAWVDHDYWCGGAQPPSRMLERVLEYLFEHRPEVELPAAFDAARARRWCPEMDQAMKMAG